MACFELSDCNFVQAIFSACHKNAMKYDVCKLGAATV